MKIELKPQPEVVITFSLKEAREFVEPYTVVNFKDRILPYVQQLREFLKVNGL